MKSKSTENQRFRLFLKGAYGTYYVEDTATGRQTSLRTRDKSEAISIWRAKNEAAAFPERSLRIGIAYMDSADPNMSKRTWGDVLQTYATAHAEGSSTRERIERVGKDKAIAPLLNLPLLRTQAEHLLQALARGSVSTNVYLRRLQNYALDCNWLPKLILPRNRWPKVRHQPKRAVTLEEHLRILEREPNPERRAFYQICWFTGGSSSDVAGLRAENIDWQNRLLTYTRKKTGQSSGIRFGSECETVLRTLPKFGPLFPYLAQVRASDRATEFKQRCSRLGILGITIHSYRYSWAERAKIAGIPERLAQAALGHSSKAVHRAYAKGAILEIPCLEEIEMPRSPLQDPITGGEEGGTKSLSA